MVDEEDEVRTHVDDAAPPPHDPSLDGRLPDGTVIDGYVIDGVIGKGGMGIVYSATHDVIGKRAAIKVLRTEVSNNPTTIERFIQEARAVNQIGHSNIIDIFDFGRLADGRAYHLMDMLDGESLRKRLRRGALHPSEAASVIEEVSSALMAAHDKGFVHRDLKPDNVFLIEQDGRWPLVKLLDFGLAKLMPDVGTAAFITKTGVVLGTPEYMSPEQARGENVDYRTDVYALGVVMFEILAGQRPFPSTGDAFLTLQYHADEPPPSIASMVPGLLPEMAQLVDAMLSKEPAARPSLAAVRTVIKRLRSTQLPTHSVAGAELASLSNPNLAAQGPIQIDSRRLGAQPTGVGHPSVDHVPRRPAPTPLTTPHLRAPTSPTIDESAQGTPQPPDDEQAATRPRAAPSSSMPPVSAAGLAGHQPLASTRLGVPPPPTPRYAPAAPTTGSRGRSTSNAWIVLGAALAVTAGVVLALVLTGTI